MNCSKLSLRALAVGCALAAAGCGAADPNSSDPEERAQAARDAKQDVADAYNGFLSDTVAKRWKAACGRTTPEFRKQLAGFGELFDVGTTCEKVLPAVFALAEAQEKEDGEGSLADAPKAKSSDVTVTGAKAALKVDGDDTVMVLRSEQWLVDADPEDTDAIGQDITEEPEPTATADTCEEKGINAEQANEGECERDGQRFDVANKDTQLTLQEMDVSYEGAELVKRISSEYGSTERAQGTFIRVRLSVTNKENSPQTFDAAQVGLTIEDKNYTPDSDASISVDDSMKYEEIQPDATLTGSVIFDVPEQNAKLFESTGNVTVLQFSDSSGFAEPEGVVGVIRSYR